MKLYLMAAAQCLCPSIFIPMLRHYIILMACCATNSLMKRTKILIWKPLHQLWYWHLMFFCCCHHHHFGNWRSESYKAYKYNSQVYLYTASQFLEHLIHNYEKRNIYLDFDIDLYNSIEIFFFSAIMKTSLRSIYSGHYFSTIILFYIGIFTPGRGMKSSETEHSFDHKPAFQESESCSLMEAKDLPLQDFICLRVTNSCPN